MGWRCGGVGVPSEQERGDGPAHQHLPDGRSGWRPVDRAERQHHAAPRTIRKREVVGAEYPQPSCQQGSRARRRAAARDRRRRLQRVERRHAHGGEFPVGSVIRIHHRGHSRSYRAIGAALPILVFSFIGGEMSLKKSVLFAGLSVAAVAAAVVVPPSTSSPAPMPILFADSLNCNVSQYKASSGLTAAVEQDLLVVSWTGQNGADLRARFAIDSGQPLIRDLAARKAGGQWATLGQNLTPEYHVVSGIRRMGSDQAATLRQAGIELCT